MTVRATPAPDEWQCLVFIALAEWQGSTEAAKHLSKLRGREYNRQSVEKALRQIERWYGPGSPLFERVGRRLCLTRHGQAFLVSARNVVTEYRLMRAGPVELPAGPRLACQPQHACFVSLAEDLLMATGESGVAVDYLRPRDCGDATFAQQAVVRLHAGVYDLVIGPPVDSGGVRSQPLYAAQLEAMVPTTYAPDVIELADLVRRFRLLLPATGTRARRLFEDKVTEWGLDRYARTAPAAVEIDETAAGVLRMHHERRELSALVAASDVALSFKGGNALAGSGDRFKWVPIVHRTPDDQDHLLRQEVCVTTRTGDTDRVDAVLRALHAAVGELNGGPDTRPRLSGGPPIPRPRTGGL